MSVVTRATAKAAAIVVRDEVAVGANTATRVGTLIENIVDSAQWLSETATIIKANALADSNVASLSGLATSADGVTLSTDGDVVVLTAQSTASENGPWVVHSGAWTRPASFAAGESASGAVFQITEGTNYGDTTWTVTTDAPNDVIDTDSLTIGQIAGQNLASVLSIGALTGPNQPIDFEGTTQDTRLVAGSDGSGLTGLLDVSRIGGGLSGVAVTDGGSPIVALSGSTAAGGSVESPGALDIEAGTSLTVESLGGDTTYAVPTGQVHDFQINAVTHLELGVASTIPYVAAPISRIVAGLAVADIAAEPAGMIGSVCRDTGSSRRGFSAWQHGASAIGARLNMFRSRGTGATAHSSPAAVVDQDGVGRLDFYGFDGADYQRRASIDVQVEGAVSAGVVPMRVGIGVSSSGVPSFPYQLEVYEGIVSHAVPISVTSGGAAVSTAALINLPRNTTLISGRNDGDTANIVILGLSSLNDVVLGDATQANDVRVVASTSIRDLIGVTLVTRTTVDGVNYQSGKRANFLGELDISRNGTPYITSAAGLVTVTQNLAVGSGTVAGTGALRLGNNKGQYSRNAGDTANVRIAIVDGSDNIVFGDNSVAGANTFVFGNTTVHMRAGGTDTGIWRATELELQSGIDLELQGTGQVLAAAGSASAPSVSFAIDPDTGLYSYHDGAERVLGVASSGTLLLDFTSLAIRPHATIQFDGSLSTSLPYITQVGTAVTGAASDFLIRAQSHSGAGAGDDGGNLILAGGSSLNGTLGSVRLAIYDGLSLTTGVEVADDGSGNPALGFLGATPIARPAYTITNDTPSRSLDLSTLSGDALTVAQVLAAVIEDMGDTSGFGLLND